MGITVDADTLLAIDFEGGGLGTVPDVSGGTSWDFASAGLFNSDTPMMDTRSFAKSAATGTPNWASKGYAYTTPLVQAAFSSTWTWDWWMKIGVPAPTVSGGIFLGLWDNLNGWKAPLISLESGGAFLAAAVHDSAGTQEHFVWAHGAKFGATAHFALRRDGASINLFVNGVSLGAQTIGAARVVAAETHVVWIAGFAAGQGWNSYFEMDNIRVSRIARSDAWIAGQVPAPTGAANLIAIAPGTGPHLSLTFNNPVGITGPTIGSAVDNLGVSGATQVSPTEIDLVCNIAILSTTLVSAIAYSGRIVLTFNKAVALSTPGQQPSSYTITTTTPGAVVPTVNAITVVSNQVTLYTTEQTTGASYSVVVSPGSIYAVG
jgi:hypothetical protein